MLDKAWTGENWNVGFSDVRIRRLEKAWIVHWVISDSSPLAQLQTHDRWTLLTDYKDFGQIGLLPRLI